MDDAGTLGLRVNDTDDVSSRRSAPDLVTTGSITYDRALLPAGFFDRGVSDSDRDWWDDQFYDALADQDQPRVQALVQGEVDRVGDHFSRMGDRMNDLGPREALRLKPALMREAQRGEALIRHVMNVMKQHKK